MVRAASLRPKAHHPPAAAAAAATRSRSSSNQYSNNDIMQSIDSSPLLLNAPNDLNGDCSDSISFTGSVSIPPELASLYTGNAKPRTDRSRYIHIHANSVHDIPLRDKGGNRRRYSSLPEYNVNHKNCLHCNPKTHFSNNFISTTKYNLLTFIPLNLFEQFRRKANFYFLLVAIISLTSLSPQSPVVSVSPLIFVLAVSAAKEAIEDYQRFKQDKQTNNRLVLVWNSALHHWENRLWAAVRVGDLVLQRDGEQFCADIVLLQTAAELGVCTIETSNLDGETNLKFKTAIPETYNLLENSSGKAAKNEFSWPTVLGRCVVQSSGPNKKLDSAGWKGNLQYLDGNSTEIHPFNMNQLLLRGCTLRNTDWIIGFVCFTGVGKLLSAYLHSKQLFLGCIEILWQITNLIQSLNFSLLSLCCCRDQINAEFSPLNAQARPH
jgi:magnesium-transporting ATPase (P-type)